MEAINNDVNEERVTDSKTGISIVHSRDSRMTEFAKKLITDYYLKNDETIQEGFARAAFAWCGNKPELAQRIYDAVSKGWFMYASPVLSNAPEVLDREQFTFKPQKSLPISCYLSHVDDSLVGLIDNASETRWLSVKGGGVGINFSQVRSDSKMSPGPIPFICTYDTDVEAYKQGKVRRGSIAIYMDITHPNITEFLKLRVPTGDASRKCHSTGFHNAINITDAFMNAVSKDLPWDLIDPYDKTVRNTISARKLWDEILDVRYRTGEPYLHFIDNANRSLPVAQKNLGLRINNSNLCVLGDTIITISYNGKIEDIRIDKFNEKYTTGFYEDVLVKSYDTDTSKVVWEKITASGKTGDAVDFIGIKSTVNEDYLVCTPEHKIFTKELGYVNAEILKTQHLTICMEARFTKDYHIFNMHSDNSIPVYDITVDRVNNFFANNILVHNCAEIELPTNNERTAVCCLSSLNLETYDEWKNTTLVQDLIEMLDNVLTYFIENTPDEIHKAKYSAMRERALGLGVMGFHYLLQKNMIPFESQKARNLNKEVFEYIHKEAIISTKRLAIERGECPDFITDLTFTLYDESKIVLKSSDIVTIISRNKYLSSTETRRAFELVPGDVIVQSGGISTNRIEIIEGKHPNTGWRNSQLEAVAPTANSGILCGTSPSIEPNNSNAYIHQTRAGSWPVKNRYLEKLLDEKNMNTEETWKEIINSSGSIQFMDIFTDEEKDIFKTAIELNQTWVIRHAADRKSFITQGQSVNMFFPAKCDRIYFSKVHYMAWKLGIKSLYYTRTVASSRAENVAEKVERVALINADEDTGCKACEG